MFAREKAAEIARDFIAKANPTNWNGIGEEPAGFNQKVHTYGIDSVNGNVLDLSLEFDEQDGWCHCCELVDKQSDCMIEMLHGYGIDSLQNLTDSILDICMNEN